MKILMLSLLLISPSLWAAQDWIGYLENSRFAGALKDCQDGSSMNFRDCTVEVTFGGRNNLGGLEGGFATTLSSRPGFHLQFWHNPNGSIPYQLEIEAPDFRRGLKSEESEPGALHFRGPTGDLQIIMFNFTQTPQGDLEILYKHNDPMKAKTTMAFGTLVRQK